ncbi:MAG: hypothetical protein Q9199_007829, partial [Rusavskia elegans]
MGVEREWKNWLREHSFPTLDPPTQARLHKIWIEFQKLWEQQQRIREDNFGEADIMAMMANLPGLKHIAVSNYYDVTQSAEETFPKSRAYKAYGDVLGNPVGEYFHGHRAAVPQLLSVLHGIDHSKLAIKTLCFGLVDWYLFTTNEVIDFARKSLDSLTRLKMRMAMAILPDEFQTIF